MRKLIYLLLLPLSIDATAQGYQSDTSGTSTSFLFDFNLPIGNEIETEFNPYFSFAWNQYELVGADLHTYSYGVTVQLKRNQWIHDISLAYGKKENTMGYLTVHDYRFRSLTANYRFYRYFGLTNGQNQFGYFIGPGANNNFFSYDYSKHRFNDFPPYYNEYEDINMNGYSLMIQGSNGVMASLNGFTVSILFNVQLMGLSFTNGKRVVQYTPDIQSSPLETTVDEDRVRTRFVSPVNLISNGRFLYSVQFRAGFTF